ncbi:MAG: GNAT family N-acetyltransferase [Actinobacteria bacterium]|uniref:Unannotated protein n=1 Tax=freshwater metagenome TaxID=449393 RepID=A0A6J6PAC9_9ZZZZ|nr:GNAT family N-acetyltransferase [Actinomycetota bacterium]
MPTPACRFEFTEDAVAFRERAQSYLAADPVTTTVVSTIVDRAIREGATEPPPHPRWWVSVVDEASGDVVGVAMRTAPFAPYPLYVLPMPEAAALELARLLHERGDAAPAANGALPSTDVLMGEVARLSGGVVQVHEHTRLFELHELREPRRAEGRARVAEARDLDLAQEWFGAFHVDAAIQAGRDPDDATADFIGRDGIAARIEAGLVWLWEDASGEVVHLTGFNPPSFGVARVGPVYTPGEQRGHGFATSLVADVSRHLLAAPARVCLFTDQANPTSNRIYQSLGYEPVVDMVNLRIVTG